MFNKMPHQSTATSSPQPIGACAIITNQQQQFLVGKRKNSYKAGWFGLPGGRVETHEPLLTAISREVAEETGMHNLQFTYVGVVREKQSTYDFIHFIFTASANNQTPLLLEPNKCEEWLWQSTDTNLNKMLPAHQAAIDMFINNHSLADLI